MPSEVDRENRPEACEGFGKFEDPETAMIGEQAVHYQEGELAPRTIARGELNPGNAGGIFRRDEERPARHEKGASQ